MDESAKYKVSFGRVARTLIYEDVLGVLVFAFDCSPAEVQQEKKWNLHLGRKALTGEAVNTALYENTPEFDANRASLALERVRLYASSCGYVVLFE